VCSSDLVRSLAHAFGINVIIGSRDRQSSSLWLMVPDALASHLWCIEHFMVRGCVKTEKERGYPFTPEPAIGLAARPASAQMAEDFQLSIKVQLLVDEQKYVVKTACVHRASLGRIALPHI
jgi:hypothetical protein